MNKTLKSMEEFKTRKLREFIGIEEELVRLGKKQKKQRKK